LTPKAFYIIKHKEHLTNECLVKLIGIKAGLNRGLNNKLKDAFTD
jgi:hypothetical protein